MGGRKGRYLETIPTTPSDATAARWSWILNQAVPDTDTQSHPTLPRLLDRRPLRTDGPSAQSVGSLELRAQTHHARHKLIKA
jgi:hypothetical protein